MATVVQQPDCTLYGRRVVIRPLDYSDLPEMAQWELHTSPHLLEHNLSFATEAGWRDWLRNRLMYRWPYGIRNLEGVLVGHFSLRELNVPKSSRLGIGLAPAYLGHGYGSDALITYLDYYFNDLGFQEMRLDVSSFNRPACHLYQKLGFVELHSFWRRAPGGVDWWGADNTNYRKGKVRFLEMRLRAIEWARPAQGRGEGLPKLGSGQPHRQRRE